MQSIPAAAVLWILGHFPINDKKWSTSNFGFFCLLQACGTNATDGCGGVSLDRPGPGLGSWRRWRGKKGLPG